jgi:hypothetical protein
MEDNLNFFGKMEDDLNILGKWKTTSIFGENGKLPQFLGEMEDDLNFIGKMEDDLNFQVNRRQP